MQHLLVPVYLAVEPLPPLARPAHVVRDQGVTLIWIDPGTLLAELVFWFRENLTDAERVVIRRAFGGSDDLTAPPPDEMLDGSVSSNDRLPLDLLVPFYLRHARSA